MKRLLFSGFAIIILASCGSKTENSSEPEIMQYTLKTDNIKGPVNTYTESYQNALLDLDLNIVEDSLKEAETYTTRYFDKNGVWTESKIYVKGALFSTAIVQFSDNGSYTGTTNKDENGNITSETRVATFTKSQLIEENIMDDEVVYRRTKDFENNKTTKMVIDNMLKSDIVHSEFTYTYNEDGLIESYRIITTRNNEEISDNVQLVKYLEFDDHGNWTQRLSYTKGLHSGQLTVRTFEYYE